MGFGHLIENFFCVLESKLEGGIPFNQLFVFGVHDLMDHIVESLMVFVVVDD